jgi:hypothetical protein
MRQVIDDGEVISGNLSSENVCGQSVVHARGIQYS